MSRMGRWAGPMLCVTFDPWQLLPGACQEVKVEAMAVNEGDYTSVCRLGAGEKAMKV